MSAAAHPSLDLLRQRHAFPCAFTFKVIGENRAAFTDEISRAIAAVTHVSPPPPSVRQSAQGAHQALTFVVHTASAEQVVEIFAALRDAPGTRFTL